MKKVAIYIVIAIAWIACVIPFALGSSSSSSSDADFTVLAVKEDNVKDYNNMPVFQEIADETGVNVYWTFNTGTQYSNNTDPLGTSGIDAIYHASMSDLTLYNYGRRGRIVAIDDYLDYMPNFSAILADRPDIAEALKSPDGHIYALPRIEEMGLMAYPNILFLNKTWVEKLIDDGNLPDGVNLTKADLVDGLDISRSDFKKILQKFNDLDMDGDGDTTDEVPLSFVYDNWQGNQSDLIASFGVPENIEHKTIVNGKVEFTVTSENWFNAIVELQDWYARGLIRSTAFTQTQDQFLARGQTGHYGSFYWWEAKTVVADPDDYIVVLPLSDDDGNRYVGVSNEQEVEKGECVVLGTCEDPEDLLAYFDAFYSPYYSAELNYGSVDSGAFTVSTAEDGTTVMTPNDDHGEQSADDFRQQNAPYGTIYLSFTGSEYTSNGVTVELESRAELRQERLEAYVKPYTYPGAETIPNLNYTADELNTLNKYETTLSNNITTYVTTCITGGTVPTYSAWQSFVNENMDMINTIISVNQSGYDRYEAALAG